MRASEERHGFLSKPPRSHNRSSHFPSLFRRLSLALLIALLVADGLSFGAQAYTTQTWNTTALFDSGTKASTSTLSDYCENVSANSLALNNTGSFLGVGMTTGSANCKTGAWGVNPASSIIALDFQTKVGGQFKDFSPNAHNLINSFGVVGPAKFGSGDNGTNGAFPSAGNYGDMGTSDWSVLTWVKMNTTLQTNFAIKLDTGLGTNPGWRLGMLNAGGAAYLTMSDGSATRILVSGGVINNNQWHCVAGQWKRTTMELLYVDGTLVATASISAQQGSVSNAQPLTFLGLIQTQQYIEQDELLIVSRNVTASERNSFCTDGRSSFASSGSWQSSSVAFTTAPAFTTLTFSGGSASNRPSRLLFTDAASGAVVFDTLIPSGLASPIQIPVNLTFNPASWKVKLLMVGSGSATATMTKILVTLGAAPLFQTSDILFLFGIVLLVLSVLCFFSDSPELDLLSFFAGMGFAVWSWFYFFAAFNNSIFALIGIGLGAMLMVLTLGKLTGDVTA